MENYLVKKCQCNEDIIKISDIKTLINHCRNLIFPWYFAKEDQDSSLKIIKELLCCQITKVANLTKIELDNKQIIESFTLELPKIIELVKSDLVFFYESDPAAESYDEIIITYPGFFASLVHRFSYALASLNVPMIPRMMSEYVHSKTGIDIHPKANIDHSFFIDHGTGIVIGETSVIGHHVKIYQGVTLGALSLNKGQALKNIKRHPTIKNYVTIYACASILGGETIIGNNVTIGANSFILESIEDNTIVKLSSVDLEYIKKRNHKMIIRHTTLNDLDEVMKIYKIAREFMKQNNNPNQWKDTTPTIEQIKKDINDYKSYVCIRENEIVGVFYFAIEEDITYYEINGKWLNNLPYGVIHRITSLYKGQGIATFIINYCFEIANNLRIDTHVDNFPMRNLLEKLGFKYCGVIKLLNNEPRNAYQKIN